MFKKLRRGFLFTSVCAAALPMPSFAEGPTGLNGAIDTPRAVASTADDLAIAIDYREDYRALTFGFQASDRLQIGLSFPTYDDDGGSSSGNELSFAYLLLSESDYVPSVAVGIVGFGSDDRGSGEYIAASKTFGPVSATAGLGWGRYASEFTGPRGSDEEGVIIETDHIFAGDYEPFANVVWQTPVDGLTAMAEYSGIAGENDDTFAAGVSYAFARVLSVSGFGTSDGDVGVRLSFIANPTEPFVQDNIARGPHPYVEMTPARAAQPQPGAQQVLNVLEERLEKEGIRITRFAMAGNAIDVTPESDTDVNFARVTGRVARVLSAVAPANITQFRITQDIGVYDANVIVLDRAQLDQAISQPDAADRAWQAATLEASPLNRPVALREEPAFEPRLTYGISPSFKADFVTSDNLEFTGTLTARARYTFTPQTFVAGSLGYRFLNQWEQIDPPAEPGVRSDARAYTPDEIYLNSLTVRHRFQLSPELYSRVSAGLFERAYGGVSAEMLWRSPQQNFALGLEATYVQKRAYEDPFGFEDADATTMIGSVYANVGQNGNFVILDAGQHLAGDMAVGLTVGRNYTNGWRIAASTTWSEEKDSPLKFGAELSIPLAWSSPGGGKGGTDIAVGGQSGDFGSRVSGTGLLYDELRSSDRRRIEDAWGQFWN